jgi:hypothetical protein
MSDAMDNRAVGGLAPRKSGAKTGPKTEQVPAASNPSPEPAPLGRLFRSVRDDEARAGQETEEPKVTVTITVPKSVRNRARAAFQATSYLENDHSWSHMVTKAIEAETLRREALHNGGESYNGGDQKLAPGRKLGD